LSSTYNYTAAMLEEVRRREVCEAGSLPSQSWSRGSDGSILQGDNMADVQVTCVNKPHRDSPHEHITHLGGLKWHLTREEVIQRIEVRTDSFYTLVGGKRADVGVRREAGRQPFVQTHADGYWNNNLLALEECRIR
jgi:uncharacterized protein DUF3892